MPRRTIDRQDVTPEFLEVCGDIYRRTAPPLNYRINWSDYIRKLEDRAEIELTESAKRTVLWHVKFIRRYERQTRGKMGG